MKIEYTPQGRRVVDRMRRPGPWFHRALEELLAEAGVIVAKEAQGLAPRDTGRGVRSINSRVRRGAAEVRAFDYMIVLDQGRRPGAPQPPTEAIQSWLLRQQGRGRLRGASAFVIARSIARRGIRPRRYFLAAVRKLRGNRAFQRKAGEVFSRRLRRG